MSTEQQIIDLRKAYELWQSLEIVVEYGPLRGYADHDTVQRLWRKTIDPAVALVADSAHKTADGVHVAEAPSPWHAFFYLRAQQQYVYRAGRPLGSPNIDDKTPGEHLFFRGQRCANWELISSLRRKEPTAQGIERRAVAALEEYFRSHFAKNEDIARNTAVCFAQHYGIATDLADISCDPDIAVWFATHPVGEACPDGESRALVQAVSWAGQQGAADTLFLLPPPFVRNVYEQRGLFIDTASTGGRLKGRLWIQVRFLRDTAGGEFRVIRRGSPLEVWPEPDAAERDLVSWARSLGGACPSEEAVRDMVKAQIHANKVPKFWLERQLYDFDEHVEAWLSILDWVLPATCVTATPVSPGPMRYEILDFKARAFVRSNPTFFRAFVGASEGANFTGFGALKAVVDLARDELAKSSPGRTV
jgi:hypothetical protein